MLKLYDILEHEAATNGRLWYLEAEKGIVDVRSNCVILLKPGETATASKISAERDFVKQAL